MPTSLHRIQAEKEKVVLLLAVRSTIEELEHEFPLSCYRNMG